MSGSHANSPIPQDLVDTLRRLEQQLIHNTLKLVESLDSVMAESPLNQRTAAIGSLLDRYLKLHEHLGSVSSHQGEQVNRIEYIYPDGSIHDTPPWAGENYRKPGPFPRGGLRAALREDGDGADHDPGLGYSGGALLVAGADLPDGESDLARYEDAPEERLRFDD